MKMSLPFIACCVLGVISVDAQALTLEKFWRETYHHDPEVRVYRNQLMAQSQSQPLALAALLPHISATADAEYNVHSIQKPYDKYLNNSVLLFRHRNNDIGTVSIEIKQSIFNWSALQDYDASVDLVAQSAAQYQQSIQHLERKAVDAYVNWLLAYADLRSVIASERAVKRQERSAEIRYRAGTIGILDVEETRVALAQINAQLERARSDLQDAGVVIEQLSGFKPPDVAPPLPDKVVLSVFPYRHWEECAMMHNPALAIAHYQLKIARKGVSSAVGGFLPRLSLVLRHRWMSESGTLAYRYGIGPGSSVSASGSGISDPHRYTGSSISIKLNWPIFSGGYQQAELARAQYREQQGFDELETTQRSILSGLRQAFVNVHSSLRQSETYRKSLVIAERASKLSEFGVGVGLIDQNNAIVDRQNALSVSKNLHESIATEIKSFVDLEYMAGNLSPSAINYISSILSSAEQSNSS